jgi:hypothetical protein
MKELNNYLQKHKMLFYAASETRTSNRDKRATLTELQNHYIASTPPVLFRIDLKIQYTIMKYRGKLLMELLNYLLVYYYQGEANKFGAKKPKTPKHN